MIYAYIIGAVLLIVTINAWIKNVKMVIRKKGSFTPTDKLLNYPLLFLWLLFMTVFSIGMIVNN